MTDDRSHLSDVQDLCTGDAVELVLGETYGLREWSLYSSSDLTHVPQDLPEDLRLVGHFGNEWDLSKPLEGTCQSNGDRTELLIAVDSSMDAELVEFTVREYVSEFLEDFSSLSPSMDPSRTRAHIHIGRATRSVDWLLDDPFSDKHRLQVPSDFMHQLRESVTGQKIRLTLVGHSFPHPVGHPSCTCGIYAYHDRNSLKLGRISGSRGFVVGLVRAYGHVTTGTKGLRAAKAQTIAVTVPQDCSISDSVQAPVLEQWKAANITILPDPAALLDFSERGGYLENPEDLQAELK